MATADEKKQILRSILPYTQIVGQQKLKLALELAYIAPRIGGVLISGKRGTAKSTTVRAFASMMYEDLPVTIPINATEDRVVGGWDIKELMSGKTVKQPGLLQEADEKLLYIDEVNLLDDHIVNIILDVTSTGKLVVQREARNDQYDVHTTLVGTMNPEEGGLRPQLLDRFGLMVSTDTDQDRRHRLQILETVLKFDQALKREEKRERVDFLEQWRTETQQLSEEIKQAREHFYDVELAKDVAGACVELAEVFEVEGHRSDYLLALAACAYAARLGDDVATLEHLGEVAELVLRHRSTRASQTSDALWSIEDEQQVAEILEHV
jgi:magnesium chelatase subunit I